MPDRTYIEKHLIINVRIRARNKNLELENVNNEIDPQHFVTSFIPTYSNTSNNYTKVNFLLS